MRVGCSLNISLQWRRLSAWSKAAVQRAPTVEAAGSRLWLKHPKRAPEAQWLGAQWAGRLSSWDAELLRAARRARLRSRAGALPRALTYLTMLRRPP